MGVRLFYQIAQREAIRDGEGYACGFNSVVHRCSPRGWVSLVWRKRAATLMNGALYLSLNSELLPTEYRHYGAGSFSTAVIPRAGGEGEQEGWKRKKEVHIWCLIL